MMKKTSIGKFTNSESYNLIKFYLNPAIRRQTNMKMVT